MQTYYHATSPNNIGPIILQGLKPSADGYVYLADSVENAIKFIQLTKSEAIVFSVHFEKEDEQCIEETFDHSAEFFKCKSFGYCGTISPDKLELSHIWRKGC